MKSQHVAFLLFLTVLVLVNSRSTNAQAKSNATSDTSMLTVAERDLLNEINDARAHPQVYVSYLEKLRPMFNDKEYRRTGHAALITEEGWLAVEDAINFLQTLKPLPPLRFSQGLYLAAQSHVKDQSSSGGLGHKGSDNTLIEQRVKRYGTWQGGIGENITYGDDSARERILTWLIDDGFPSRGHRRRVLSTDYHVAGISCGSHPEFSVMCVLTLAGEFTDLGSTTSANSSQPSTTATTPVTKTSGSTKPATTQPSKTKAANSKARKF